jgi:hypothetical protein
MRGRSIPGLKKYQRRNPNGYFQDADLGYSKVFAKLIAGDSVFAVNHKPDSGKPLLKRIGESC